MNSRLSRLVPLAVLAVAFTLTSKALAQYTETIVYDFGGYTHDATNPFSPIIFDAQGNIYGTSGNGGLYGFGTVFELAPNSGGGWTETILYNFTGGADGQYPGPVAWDSHGNLFGPADGGSTACNAGCGLIFELSPSSGGGWTEQVLYTFTNGADGGEPVGPLAIDANGNMFGVTQTAGGRQDTGTIFELSPASGGTWTFNVILDLGTFSTGTAPSGGLIFDATGSLYGAAPYGGRGGDGQVFRLSPSSGGTWTYTTLYTFLGAYGPRGSVPQGRLAFDPAGNLYGVTQQGGKMTTACYTGGGCGVVYKLTPTASGPWTETILHAFLGNDGWEPIGGVTLDAAGNAYGSTSAGGTGNCESTKCGAAFKLTPVSGGWTFQRIANFSPATGEFPYSHVVLDGAGNVYGTTNQGGAYCVPYGCGVVYELSPPASRKN